MTIHEINIVEKRSKRVTWWQQYEVEMKQKSTTIFQPSFWFLSLSVYRSVCLSRYPIHTPWSSLFFNFSSVLLSFFSSFGCYINYGFFSQLFVPVSFSLPLSNIRSNIYKLKSQAYKPIVVHLSIPMMVDHNSFVVGCCFFHSLLRYLFTLLFRFMCIPSFSVYILLHNLHIHTFSFNVQCTRTNNYLL